MLFKALAQPEAAVQNEHYDVTFPKGAMGLDLAPILPTSGYGMGARVKTNRGTNAAIHSGDLVCEIEGEVVLAKPFSHILETLRGLGSRSRVVRFKKSAFQTDVASRPTLASLPITPLPRSTDTVTPVPTMGMGRATAPSSSSSSAMGPPSRVLCRDVVESPEYTPVKAKPAPSTVAVATPVLFKDEEEDGDVAAKATQTTVSPQQVRRLSLQLAAEVGDRQEELSQAQSARASLSRVEARGILQGSLGMGGDVYGAAEQVTKSTLLHELSSTCELLDAAEQRHLSRGEDVRLSLKRELARKWEADMAEGRQRELEQLLRASTEREAAHKTLVDTLRVQMDAVVLDLETARRTGNGGAAELSRLRNEQKVWDKDAGELHRARKELAHLQKEQAALEQQEEKGSSALRLVQRELEVHVSKTHQTVSALVSERSEVSALQRALEEAKKVGDDRSLAMQAALEDVQKAADARYAALAVDAESVRIAQLEEAEARYNAVVGDAQQLQQVQLDVQGVADARFTTLLKGTEDAQLEADEEMAALRRELEEEHAGRLDGQRDADEVITQLQAELDEERVGRMEDQQVIGEDLMRIIDEQGALQSVVECSLADAVDRLRVSEDHRQQTGLERDVLADEVADAQAAHAAYVKQVAAERVEIQERLDAQMGSHSRFVAHTQAEQLAQSSELVQLNDVVQALTAARQEIEMDASGLRMQLTETSTRADVAEMRLATLLERCTEEGARSEVLEGKNGELYNNFCSLEIEVGHLKGSLEALQAHKHSAMAREAELEDRLRMQQTAVLELERQLAEDRDGFSQREAELLGGVALAEDIQSSVQSDLKASLAEKEAALMEAHAAADVLRSSLAELETYSATAEAETAGLRVEMASLRGEVEQRDADYDKLQAEYMGLQESLAAEKSVMEETGGQVAELKRSVNGLLEDLHYATHVEAVEKDRQIEVTKAQNEELAAELQTALLMEGEAARKCRETDVALADALEQESALRALVLTSAGGAGAAVAVLKQQVVGLREENTVLQHAFAEMQARLGGVLRGVCAAAAVKEAAVARLAAELEEAGVSCATGDMALSELRVECSRLELENSELTKRCIELQSHVHDADAAAAESDEALTAVTADKVRVSVLLEEAEGRAQDLMVDAADANDAIVDLQMQMQALQQEKEEEVGRACGLVKQEVQSRTQLEESVVRITADMDFERSRAEALSLTLKKSEAREELAAHSVECLRGDVDEAQSKCAQLATEVTQLMGRLQARAEESGATMAGMEERVLMLKRELDERGEEARVDRAALMTQYEEMLASARADHAQLVGGLQEDFGAEREVFEQSLAEVTAAAQEGDGAKATLLAREKHIDELVRNAHALVREKRAIETVLAKSKAYVGELKTELVGLTTAHKLAVTAAKNKEKRFRVEIDAAREAHVSDRDTLCLASSSEVARLHDEHADALATLQGALAVSQNELEEFRGRATAAYIQLEQAGSAQVAEVTEQMQGEAESKQKYIADIEEQLDTYQDEMEANRSRLTSMRETLQMQQDALEAAEQREAEYHDNLAQVEQSSRNAIAQVVSVEETMAEMSRVLGCTRAENVELQQLVMDKKVELEALHATLNNFVNDNVTPEKEALLAGNLTSPRQAKDEAGWRVEKNKRRLAILMEWHQEIMQVSCALHERCTFALALDADISVTAPSSSSSSSSSAAAATASLMNISRTYHDLSVRLAMAPWINSNSRRNKLQPMLAPHEMVQQMQGGSGHGSIPPTCASTSTSIASSTNASAGSAPSEVSASTESLRSSGYSVGGSRESHDMGKIATYLEGVSSMRERSNRVQDEVVVSRAEHEVRKLSMGMGGMGGRPVQSAHRTPRQSPGRGGHSGHALPSPDAHIVVAANDAWDEDDDFFNLSADSARSD